MYYTSKLLNKMISEPFFAYDWAIETKERGFIYDDVKTEKNGSCKIVVTVPGYSKDDLVLSVNDATLKLSSVNEKDKLERYWKLNDIADLKNIKADCKNGLLTINIPVREKSDQSHKITIE